MLPSAAELEYFTVVSKVLNLSRAAERLGISQPSLSLAIKRLEESVGTQLFTRHQHGVKLTQAGKQLLSQVKQLLQYWENAKGLALASHHEVQGSFTIGCHPVMVGDIISGFLPDLLNQYPKLDIQLKLDISRHLTQEVINLAVDLAIVANPLKHPDLIIHKLNDDVTGFWTGQGNRDIQDIHSKNAIVLCNLNLSQTQTLLKDAKKKGISFSRIINVESLEAVANLTANGCGIGIMPGCLAESNYANQLQRVVKTLSYRDEICLIYRNENRNIYAIKTIIDTIKTYYKNT